MRPGGGPPGSSLPELLINSKAAAGKKVLSVPGIYFQLVSAAAACGSASLCAPCTICDYSTVTTSAAALMKESLKGAAQDERREGGRVNNGGGWTEHGGE